MSLSSPHSRESSSVFVLNRKNEILLLRRSITDSWMPLHWDLPGGLVDPGETSADAAFREVEEEAGIVLEYIDFIDSLIEYGYKINFFLSDVLDYPRVKLSFEHDSYSWMTTHQILNHSKIIPRIKTCLHRIIRR